TLAGEGLQHQDGHSHILSGTIPNCVSYDPTFAYELAVIIQNGLHRMYEKMENVFYYITVMNENYQQPDMPEGVEEGILKGMYLFKESKKKSKSHVQLMGCGTILREVLKAAEMLEEDFSVTSDIWSVTSFNELRRDGLKIERDNLMHPNAKAKECYVTTQLKDTKGPVIAATDYMRLYADQIRPFVPNHFVTLGTDGYGRSDTRAQLRHFFEVDAKYIVLAALNALASEGAIDKSKVLDAMKRYSINPDKLDPVNH
ncbi:MAG: pyruvate dehydrogenase (acetyl-transferring), homodimeric type, partial [Thalassolituus sp. CG17_big_fil_post_rev_8_21_14_2_50_53_8]